VLAKTWSGTLFQAVFQKKEILLMDFIERIVHVSPDGGSGATEILFLLVPVLLAILMIVWRRRMRSL
jgi:hypothetical protein